MKKWTWIIIAIALIAAAGGIWLLAWPKASTDKAKESYELATVARGSIESIVSSSGTLSAVSTVSILSQMSGSVEKVHADYNDRVKKGEVLVELNTDMLRLEEKEAEAAVRKALANYDLQQLDVQNKTQLASKALISDYDLKSSTTTLEVCAAELASAQSALESIQTRLDQYALITSPIDGIVLDRNVDVGQSVVEGSSANASSIFTIAEDLARMEIKAEVDELDIASIKPGQEVRFTAEAYPSVTFNGKVHQIRLVPETTDNVVNYCVMIDADNNKGKLLPGMTAQVEFIKENRRNVLTVPNAALRFQPSGLSDQEIQAMIFTAGLADLPPDQREAAQKMMEAAKAAGAVAGGDGTKTQARGLAGMMMPMGPPPGSRNNANATAASGLPVAQDKKALWYLDGSGKLAVRMVKTGTSNGTSTEIIGADDLEGKTIIVKTKVE